MKLIYLHQYFKFPNEPGGTRSYDLAKAFTQYGHRVDILTTTAEEKYKSSNRWYEENRDGLTVHYVYLPYSNEFSSAKRILIFLQFLWFSTFKALTLEVDLVLATSTPLTIGIPALVKKWIHGTPFIFEARDVWPAAVIAIGAINNKFVQKMLFWFEKLVYKQAAAIVPLSSDMEKSIVSRYPELKAKPVIVIENIASLERFGAYEGNHPILIDRLGSKPRFNVLYAGTFGKVNGIDYVVDLAEKVLVLDPGIVFLMVGDGAEKQTILDLAVEKKVLDRNFFLLESVAKDDLPQLYFEADIGSSFVVPIKELWANSANKFFDTLAAGRPILINHGGWQKEVIQEDNLGYVLPTVISEEAARNFVAYTQDEVLHQVQRQNALGKAKAAYSLEVASRKYLDVFDKIL